MYELVMLVGVICFLVIAGMIVADLVRPGGQALSWRNVFLIGYALFFCSGPAFLASEKFANPYYVPTTNAIGMLAFFIPTFLIVFLVGCWLAKKMPRVSNLIPTCRMPLSFVAVVTLVGVCMSIAVVTTAIPIESFLGLLLAQFRDGWLAASVGLCTYFLISQKKNPMALALFIVVVPIAAIISTTGSIGRRSIISVFFIAGWVTYYFYLRYRSRTTRLSLLAIGSVALVLIITVYSSFRGQFAGVDQRNRTSVIMNRVTQFKEAVLNPKIDTELLWSLVATDPAIYTGYLFDMVPENIAHEPFHGAIFYLSNPIPRRVWPSKPDGIGSKMQKTLNLQFNVGPGIIGHGWYEGAAVGVFGYAIFFGLLVGLVDGAIRKRLDQPLFIIAVGTSIGNILALPRGETSLFLLLISAGFASSMGMFIFVNLVFGKVLIAFPPLPHPAASIPPEKLDPGALAQDDLILPPQHAEWDHDPEIYTADAELAETYWDHTDDHPAPRDPAQRTGGRPNLA